MEKKKRQLVLNKGTEKFFNYYKTLIRLRKNFPVFRSADIHMLQSADKTVLSFLKTDSAERLLVLINFSGLEVTHKLVPGDVSIPRGNDILCGEDLDLSQGVLLNPYQSRFVRLTGQKYENQSGI